MCSYCDAPAETRDHILPRARGSFDGRSLGINNFRPACARCNQLRAVLWHCPAALMAFHAIKRSMIMDRSGNVGDREILMMMGAVKMLRRDRRLMHRAIMQAYPRATLADVWPRGAAGG
jgi:hypothetical protein